MTACSMNAGSYAGLRNEALDYARNQGFVNQAKASIRRASDALKREVSALEVPRTRVLVLTFLITFIAFSALLLLFPDSASAWGLDDVWNGIVEQVSKIGDAIGNFFTDFINKNILEPLSNGLMQSVFSGIAETASSSDVIVNFDSLLGSYGGAANVYNLITNVSNAAVKPVAATLLAMGMLLQLLKIAKKMDQGGGMMPSVREVFALFVWCAVMMYLVRHGLDIVKDLYTLVLGIIKNASGAAQSGGISDLKKWADTKDIIKFGDKVNIADGIMILFSCILMDILARVAVIVSYYVVIARSIELYLTAMFAPIPFALFGFDETRSWGWGYLKNFLALCLSGVVIIVILYLFPYLVVSILGDPSVGVKVGNVFMMSCKLIAACFVLIVSLTKSTTIARQAIGG